MKRSVYSLFSVMVVLALAAAGRGATTVSTDNTWEVTRNNGASFFAPDTFTTRTLPDGSTATGIFGGNPSNIADEWYVKSFTLTDPTTAATVHFSTNDLFSLLVNGNAVDLSTASVVGTTGDRYTTSPAAGLSIPGGFFAIGSNQIVFKTRVSGDKFLAARLDVNVPEPTSCALFGCGCAIAILKRPRPRSRGACE